MKSNLKYFGDSKTQPIDKFFNKVLYDKKFGYYTTKYPFGEKGDYITSPKISNLFSEIIAVWLISTWEFFGKPKNFNIIELGPGDGSLTKILIKTFTKFPKFNSIKKIFLYEKSRLLRKIQKENIKNNQIKWIGNFNEIKKGPIVFFGNEFFDAIPIKQFKKTKNILFERNFTLDEKYKIKEIYRKATKKNTRMINSFSTLKKLNFIEFPQTGLDELKKVTNKINKLQGCILMIDYGYSKTNNQNTLQSIMRHKKNSLLKNLGKADVTSHVNFRLLNEFFQKKNLGVKKIITQKKFLENMGIIERANILSKKMKFREQSNLYLRLKRLLSPQYMGDLFKVILAYKFKKSNFVGFK